jgi:hypothetical protein
MDVSIVMVYCLGDRDDVSCNESGESFPVGKLSGHRIRSHQREIGPPSDLADATTGVGANAADRAASVLCSVGG